MNHVLASVKLINRNWFELDVETDKDKEQYHVPFFFQETRSSAENSLGITKPLTDDKFLFPK